MLKNRMFLKRKPKVFSKIPSILPEFKTISKRLIFGFSIALGMSALVGGAGILGARSISQTISSTAEIALPRAEAAAKVTDKTVKLQSTLLGYLGTESFDDYKEKTILGIRDELTSAVNLVGDENLDFANELLLENIQEALAAHTANSAFMFTFENHDYSLVSFLNFVVVDSWDYLKTLEQSIISGSYEAITADPTQTPFARWVSSYTAPNEALKEALQAYQAAETGYIDYVANTLLLEPENTVENLAELKSLHLAKKDETMKSLLALAQVDLDAAAAVKSEKLKSIQTYVNNLMITVRAEQNLSMGDMNHSVVTAQDHSKNAVLAIAAIFLIGLTGSILAAVNATRTIGRPLGDLSEVIKELADRKYDVDVPYQTRADEIGAIAAAAETFLKNGIAHDALEKEQAIARETAEAERIAREKAERKAELDAIEAQHKAEEAENARILKAEQEAEAERQMRHAEQSLVVESLASGLKQLASGDLSVKLTTPFVDSYDQLRLDFNEAVETLSTAVASISGSALTISDNVNELSSAANDLALRTERSAASLEETSSALALMTNSVSAASSGAEDANGLVQSTRNESEASREIVETAVQAMSDINASSEKISKITTVIDDIAFQTNLLALNAGVEAARAGEAGRGFAVVASEVRSLAQRSSEAAREISALIAQSGSQVKHGVELVDKVGSALSSIVESVTEVSSHVSSIATTSREQATGISEINQNVTDMDRTTQKNAAMFEETTAATQSLAIEANKLSKAISNFKVGPATSGSPSAPNIDAEAEGDWADFDDSNESFEGSIAS